MMLALVGSGEYLSAIEPVDRALIERLPGPVRVACLPTAAGTEGRERIRYWAQLGVDHFTRLGVPVEAVPVTDRSSADDPDHAAAVERANFVYLSGGKPDYLMRSLENTRTWQAILRVLENGGLLAGCSAGAMIMGEQVYNFPGTRPGFKFIPGALIIPHYDEISPAMLAGARMLIDKNLMLLGIEGSTALVKSGERYEVLGKGGVTVWKSGSKVRYTQGPIEL